MTELEAVLHERERPLSVAEYEALARTGAFQNERVELVRGRLIRMAPQGDEHAWTIETMNELLIRAFGARARVRPQLPIRSADDSMPEPDFTLVERRDEPGPHPSRVFLVIEVADSSLRYDRSIKAPLYAEGTTPEYWIVNTATGQLEVFRRPVDGAFTEHFVLGREDVIRPVAFPDIEFPLKPFLLARPH
jgi:Uma2 family endonuclease